jgi:hypothetical protein
MLFATGLLSLAGCTSVSSRNDNVLAPSFELIFHKGVTWSDNHKGFDPTLPGFHVVGSVGEIVLRPITEKLPEEFILAIRTSPGVLPMLESFTLVSPDTILESVPFDGSTTVWNAKGDRQKDILSKVAAGTYFQFEIVGDEVYVSFLTRGISLLKEECKIRWVDWYRE